MYAPSTLPHPSPPYLCVQKRTPWLSIFTSLPVWGLIICYLCDGWGFYVLLTCMPTFIQQTLGCSHSIVSSYTVMGTCNILSLTALLSSQPIVMNGVYSAIPYTLLFVVVMLTGPVSDYIRSHWLSRTVSGKIFAFAGYITCYNIHISQLQDTSLLYMGPHNLS